MNIKTLTLGAEGFPERLSQIPSPPKILYHAGAPLAELLDRPCVTIVGSRSVSTYGRQVTIDIAGRLAEQGIVIVSGLALGIDSLAHRTALEAGGLAIAVLPSPLQNIVPRNNRHLARQILDGGGALVSEYPEGTPPLKQNFIARNRLMAGLGQVTVITEAGEKSGSIYTANFALEQGKTVLAVPGNITNYGSVGTNGLLKTGASLLTSFRDVLFELGLYERTRPVLHLKGRNANEQVIIDLLVKGVSQGEELLRRSQLPPSSFNQALTMLELGGKIRALGANHWAPY
jgi:DNA processing protein